jgi:outer membrane biosynthesis protein TonB
MGDGNEAITRFGARRPLPTRDGRAVRAHVLGRPGPRAAGTGPRLHAPPPRPKGRPVDLDHMVGGYIVSGLLHALVFLAIVTGLPDFLKKKPPEETAIAVKLINLSEFTRATQRNPHPVREAKAETPPAPVPTPEPPKAEETPPTPAPPPPSQQVAQTPPPPAPEPKPTPPTPAPPPPPAPTPEPKPAPPPPPPKPESKPEPPKPPAKPEPPKPQDKKLDQSFDALLKNLTRQQPVSTKTDAPPKQLKQTASAAAASAQPDAPLGSQITTSEKDQIAAAVQQCWYDDPGARGNDAMNVVVRVWIDPDGTVQRTEIVDGSGSMSDPVWRAFAERARRAPLNPQCNKLPIPPEKYDQLKVFTFTFTPQGVS